MSFAIVNNSKETMIMKSTAYYAPDFCHEPHNDFRQAEYERSPKIGIESSPIIFGDPWNDFLGEIWCSLPTYTYIPIPSDYIPIPIYDSRYCIFYLARFRCRFRSSFN